MFKMELLICYKFFGWPLFQWMWGIKRSACEVGPPAFIAY